MRNNKTFFLKVAGVCLSLVISSSGFASRDKGKEKEDRGEEVGEEENLVYHLTHSGNNVLLEERAEEAFASEDEAFTSRDKGKEKEDRGEEVGEEENLAYHLTHSGNNALPEERTEEAFASEDEAFASESDLSDFTRRRYNSTHKKSQQRAGKSKLTEEIPHSIYYPLPTNIALFLARNVDPRNVDPTNNSKLYIPPRVYGMIIIADSQTKRNQLTQLIDFRLVVQKLKSEIGRLKHENEIKKAIVKHRKGPSSWGTSLLNSWVRRNEKINKNKVESELSLEAKASLVNQTPPLFHDSSERRDCKNSSRNPPNNTNLKSPHFVLYKMKAVCKEMLAQLETGGESSNRNLLLHHNISAETSFSVDDSSAEIEELIAEYQGITKKEQEESLLSQYQAALKEWLELEASIKQHQLQPESRYLEVSPLRPIATEVTLKLSNDEDELNPLKELNLNEVKSLSLCGPKFRLVTAISLVENFLPHMENLEHLSLESEISEEGAIETILSALVKPLKSLKIGHHHNDAVLQEIQQTLNFDALENLSVLGHPPWLQGPQTMTQEGLEALLLMLSEASQLVHLDVHNLSLHQRIKQFSKALSAHMFLESLNLRGININGVMLDDIVTALHPSRFSAMKVIDVRDNPALTIYDILCLEEIFPKSTILTSKDPEEKKVAMERLQQRDMQNIRLENIQEKVEKLKRFNLSAVRSLLLTGKSFNQQLTSLLYSSLLRMIKLTKLSLKFHEFDPEIVGETLNFIPDTLTSLTLGPDFDYRNFGEIRGYKKLEGLHELILPGYPQGQDYMQHLGIILWQTPNLLTLDLRANFNIACALEKFGIALKVLPHLTTLRLTMRGLRKWGDLRSFITNDISETLKTGTLEIDLTDVDIEDSAIAIPAQIKFLRTILPEIQFLYTAQEEDCEVKGFLVPDPSKSSAQPTILYLNPPLDEKIETPDASTVGEKPRTDVGCSGSHPEDSSSEDKLIDVNLDTETEEEGWILPEGNQEQ